MTSKLLFFTGGRYSVNSREISIVVNRNNQNLIILENMLYGTIIQVVSHYEDLEYLYKIKVRF